MFNLEKLFENIELLDKPPVLTKEDCIFDKHEPEMFARIFKTNVLGKEEIYCSFKCQWYVDGETYSESGNSHLNEYVQSEKVVFNVNGREMIEMDEILDQIYHFKVFDFFRELSSITGKPYLFCTKKGEPLAIFNDSNGFAMKGVQLEESYFAESVTD